MTMEPITIRTAYTIEVITPDMFGEIQKLTGKFIADCWESLCYDVFDTFGENEFEVTATETILN